MPVVNLRKGYGRGHKEYFGVSAITGTGDIETGLAHITSAVPAVQDSPVGAGATDSVAVSAVAVGKVSVVVTLHEAAANSIEVAARNVALHAIGE